MRAQRETRRRRRYPSRFSKNTLRSIALGGISRYDPNAPQRFFSGVSFPTGAYHAAEIQFVFPTSGNTFSPDQQQLSRAMVSYWAHFAWFSNPNGFDTANWPKFDATLQQNQLLAPGAQHPVTTFKADHQCAA